MSPVSWAWRKGRAGAAVPEGTGFLHLQAGRPSGRRGSASAGGWAQAGCRGAASAQPTLLLKRRERLRLGPTGRGAGSPRTSQRRSAPSCEAV